MSPEDFKFEEVIVDPDYADGFILEDLLGEGGVGRVFLGFDKNIKREVAIKEPVTDKEGIDKERILARFIREARIAGQLEHPNIIPVYEFNTKPDGSYYYVMRYVHGQTLHQSIKDSETKKTDESFRKRMELLNNFISVCDAMGYAHSKGIIHRDLKPGNIVIGDYGETIILDWGLAKAYKEEGREESKKIPVDISLLDDEADSVTTRQDEFLGTPSYMAPEQIDPKFGEVDPKSDVYSLGVMLFMLLTGEKPYFGRKGKDVLKFIVSDNPSPSPDERYDEIPPELIAICKKAMAKNKKERFNDASQMAKELKAYRDGRLVSIYNYSRMELFKRFVVKNKLAISLSAAVVLSIIIGAGFAFNFAVEAHEARLKAEMALVDVANLSESAMTLSHDVAVKLNDYLENLKSDMKGAKNPKRLVEKYPEVEEFFAEGQLSKNIVPDKVFRTQDNRFGFYVKSGKIFALITVDKLTLSAIPFDPLKSEYQVWCMQDDGDILYDEDPKQVGKHLFTDAMYAKFPELLAFGDKMRNKPLGIGYYSFLSRGEGPTIYKIAAWDTINQESNANWKIVVTYPYISK